MARKIFYMIMLSLSSIACVPWGAPLFAAVGAGPSEEPRVELYTFGPGDTAFTAFGHAALCTFEGEGPGLCYNYGITDFSRPIRLAFQFARGTTRFWAVEESLESMIEAYRTEDRTIYRQRLPLTSEQARRAVEMLAGDVGEKGPSYYGYHHYYRNCSTELRDRIDLFTGGALRPGTEAPYPETFRQATRRALDAHTVMLTLSELLGWPLDEPRSHWEAMFLPEVLRAEVHLRLGAEPEVVYERRAPLPRGNPWTGQAILWGLAVLLGGGVAAGSRTRWRQGARIAAAALLVFLSLHSVGMLLFSKLPEARINELLLLFWPTDLALFFLPERWARLYARARLVALGLVLLATLGGWLLQPLLAPLVLAAGLLASWALPGDWSRRPSQRID